MKAYSFNRGNLTEGIRVSKDDKFGTIVFLGESGRGRRYEKISLANRNPAQVLDSKIQDAVLKPIIIKKGTPQEKTSYVLERPYGPDLDGCVVVRINTSYTYTKGTTGSWETIAGEPATLVKGCGAHGLAGRIGSWDDGLVAMMPGDVLRVKPEGGYKSKASALYFHEGTLKCMDWEDYQAWAAINSGDTNTIQWSETVFGLVTLSGNSTSSGINVQDGKYAVSGGHGRPDKLLCYGTEPEGDYSTVLVGQAENGLFLKPTSGNPSGDRELVLVHEYSPGSGGKRWPSFHIDWENAGNIQKLASESRGAGSGSDTYTLVTAPAGWANNIASQFVRERNYPNQTIGYLPGFDPSAENAEVPSDLKIAFGGDVEKVKEFMAKVEKLNVNRLDEHTVCNCGRGRVETHLIQVSGDEDFFMGADANRVKNYIAERFFQDDSDWEQNVSDKEKESGDDFDPNNPIHVAMRKAGLK